MFTSIIVLSMQRKVHLLCGPPKVALTAYTSNDSTFLDVFFCWKDIGNVCRFFRGTHMTLRTQTQAVECKFLTGALFSTCLFESILFSCEAKSSGQRVRRPLAGSGNDTIQSVPFSPRFFHTENGPHLGRVPLSAPIFGQPRKKHGCCPRVRSEISDLLQPGDSRSDFEI